MEPKPKTGTKVRSVVGVKSQKATKSTDNSGGRQVASNKKLGGSVVTAPIAPPRLKSRSGGQVVSRDNQRSKLKR